MKAINNAYVIEGHVKPHVVQGKRKRDMLSFQEEITLQLIGNVRSGGKGSGRKRRSSVEEEKRRLANVGVHLPQKGEGKDHRCIVCRKKRAVWIDAYPEKDVKECPYSLSKTTFSCSGCEPANSVYLCIRKDNNCFADYHTKVQFWR